MEIRICNCCKEEKPIDDFPKSKIYKSGYLNICKICRNRKAREWCDSNRRLIAVRQKRYNSKHTEIIVANRKKWQENNRERTREYAKSYYTQNSEKVKTKIKQYYEDNPWKYQEVRQKYQQKIFQNYEVRLNNSLSKGIRAALKENKHNSHWESLVGYTLQELINHLGLQFKDCMTWDNYGEWHIDHKIPQSFFKFSSPKDVEFKYCWSLDNLQPLWARDNIIKSNKIAI